MLIRWQAAPVKEEGARGRAREIHRRTHTGLRIYHTEPHLTLLKALNAPTYFRRNHGKKNYTPKPITWTYWYPYRPIATDYGKGKDIVCMAKKNRQRFLEKGGWLGKNSQHRTSGIKVYYRLINLPAAIGGTRGVWTANYDIIWTRYTRHVSVVNFLLTSNGIIRRDERMIASIPSVELKILWYYF